MLQTPHRVLAAAGGLTFVIAAIHVAAIFIGPRAFEYLDAHDLAVQSAQGSALPNILTLGVVAVLLVFALYALSGAGALRRLPGLNLALGVIGAIFTLRGTGFLWFTYLSVTGSTDAIPREIFFSLVSLGLGLMYLWGRRGIAARG